MSFKDDHMSNLVSLYNVCAVVAAEGDVKELLVFA